MLVRYEDRWDGDIIYGVLAPHPYAGSRFLATVNWMCGKKWAIDPAEIGSSRWHEIPEYEEV